MDANILNRNIEITKKNLISRMHKLLDILSNLLNSELSGGFGIFFKTAFNFLYRILIQGSIRRDAEESIKDIITICIKVIKEDICQDQKEFDDLLKEGFPSYMQYDSISRLGKKRHKNFPRIESELKKLFKWYVASTVTLLRVEDKTVSNYSELYRASYPTKREGLNREKEQFDILMEMLSIVEEDLNILSVPVSRKLLYRILMKGYLLTIDEIEKEITDIYHD